MNQTNSVFYQPETKSVQIKTDLTKYSVMRVLSELSTFKDFQVIDLKEVNKVDTSALAFLIEIRKISKIPPKIIHPPSDLLQLADLVEVDFLFE